LAGALLASCLILGLAEADKLLAAAEPQEEKQDGFKRLTGPIFDIIKGEEEPAAPDEGGASGTDPGAKPADSAAGDGSVQAEPAETPPISPYGPPPDAEAAPLVSPYGPPPDAAAPPAEALVPLAPAEERPKEAPPAAVETAPAAPPATPPAADAPDATPISPYGAPPEEAIATPPAATPPATPSVTAPPAITPPAITPPAIADAPPEATPPAEAAAASTEQVAQPLQTVQELLRKKPAPEIAEMEALLKRLEATPASEEATFLLVRSLARREPSYHLRLGAFFDPLDTRPKGQMEPNVQFAYEEYSLASDLPEAKERIKALTAYLDTPEAQGVAGLSSLKAQLGK
jgi:hypothetical protein